MIFLILFALQCSPPSNFEVIPPIIESPPKENENKPGENPNESPPTENPNESQQGENSNKTPPTENTNETSQKN